MWCKSIHGKGCDQGTAHRKAGDACLVSTMMGKLSSFLESILALLQVSDIAWVRAFVSHVARRY